MTHVKRIEKIMMATIWKRILPTMICVPTSVPPGGVCGEAMEAMALPIAYMTSDIISVVQNM